MCGDVIDVIEDRREKRRGSCVVSLLQRGGVVCEQEEEPVGII